MRVLLKNIKNGKYVENLFRWTEEPAKALIFGGAMEALFYCCKHKLRDVAIQGDGYFIPLTDIEWEGADRLAE